MTDAPVTSPRLELAHLTVDAIRRYRETRPKEALYNRLVREDDAYAVAAELAFDDTIEAEQHLIRALICWGIDREGDVDDCLKVCHPARGVVLDGRLYLALPYPDLEIGQVKPGGSDAMFLAEVPMASVVDLIAV